MTPGARAAAVIALCQEIETGAQPADVILTRFFKENRYAGSKDRRAIRAQVYDMLRHRARLDWWLQTQEAPVTARTRLLAWAVLTDGAAAAQAIFAGIKYGPDPLTDAETPLLAGLDGQSLDQDGMPAWVVGECPEWIYQRLNPPTPALLAALNNPAPVDLRVNTLKTTRKEAAWALQAEHIEAVPTVLSPVGLRLSGPARLTDGPAFREGLVEVQDEGSQLCALLVGAAPGMTIVDYCAGAGGKTLAMAAQASGEATIFAHDGEETRLRRIIPRLKRAGVTNVHLRLPDPGTADRLLVDAPCSGTGRWRRAPETKWTLTPEDVAEFVALQRRILTESAALVAPGGWLVYVTCSLLPEENAAQVSWFLDTVPGFEALDLGAAWQALTGQPPPDDSGAIRLSPDRHGTDGFFCAALRRQA
ncbi:MAG: RsmB/NOP family class I SAM-dependent RNA methyltransferase [Magnetospiraceae bacterium]